MEKLIEKYQAKYEKVLNAYQTKKDLTEDDRMYLRDKMRGLLEIIEDLKSVGNDVNTGDSGLHLQRVSGSAPLKAEAYVKEYFNLPEKWNEKDRLPNGTDIGIIVDLLVGFADKHYR